MPWDAASQTISRTEAFDTDLERTLTSEYDEDYRRLLAGGTR